MGYHATQARKLGLGGATDVAIWREAEKLGAVVVSMDSDFAALAKSSARARLIHFQGGNMTKNQLLKYFASRLPEIITALESGERVVEFR